MRNLCLFVLVPVLLAACGSTERRTVVVNAPPGSTVVVRDQRFIYDGYRGFVQRISGSRAAVLFEGGNWDTIKTHMESFYDATIAKMPIKRLGQPNEVANAIAFLASPAASLITGANLVIDGGYTKRIKF